MIVDALAAADAEAAELMALNHLFQRGRELVTYLGIPAQELERREMQAHERIRKTHLETSFKETT